MALMAVVLVILGGLAVLALMRSETEHTWNPKVTSNRELVAVQDALTSFQRTYRRLPCIAPLNVPFGSTITAQHPTMGNVSVQTGEEIPGCAQGLNAALAATERINLGGGVFLRFGALPTKTLGLPDTVGEDAWSRRLVYVVTEALTDPLTFSSRTGAITVYEPNAAISEQAYVVLSRGSNGVFGFQGKSGVQFAVNCNASQGLEQENCTSNGSFVALEQHLSEGPNYFDDQLSYAAVDSVAQATQRACLRSEIGNATWGAGCANNNWADMLHGAPVQSIAHNVGSGTGSADITCSDGALVYSNTSCTLSGTPCTAQTISWGAGCSATMAAPLNDGVSDTLTNSAAGYDGSVVLSCNGGALSQSGASCTPQGDPHCNIVYANATPDYRFEIGQQAPFANEVNGDYCQGVDGAYCHSRPSPGNEHYACWARPPVDCFRNCANVPPNSQVFDGTGATGTGGTPGCLGGAYDYCRNGSLQSTPYLGPNAQGL